MYNMFFSGEIRIPPEKERTDIEKSLRILTIRAPNRRVTP